MRETKINEIETIFYNFNFARLDLRFVFGDIRAGSGGAAANREQCGIDGRKRSPSSGSLIFKTFGAMFLIIGLLFFGAWGVKKYGLFGVLKKSADDSVELRVSSSVSVGNGQTISVVRFGERILLVGSTPQSFTLLADEIGGEIASGNLQPKSVSDLLAEENANFGKELNFAQNRLDSRFEDGGKLL